VRCICQHITCMMQCAKTSRTMTQLDAAASIEVHRGLSFLLGVYLTGQPRLKHLQV
jgi:hypothetical protein